MESRAGVLPALAWLGWLALLRGVTLGMGLRPPSEGAESSSPFPFENEWF